MRKLYAAIAGCALALAGCASLGPWNWSPPIPSNNVPLSNPLPFLPTASGVPIDKAARGAGAAEPCRSEASAAASRPAGYRQILVSGKAPDGTATPLSASDLRLSQGEKEIAIQSLTREPASVGILVDTSGSMYAKLPQAKAALTDLINNLEPDDDVFLVGFSSRHYTLQSDTTNHALVLQKLSLLRANGETALFDTILEGLFKIRQGCRERKALFVLTDGIDNVSSSTRTDVIAAATKEKVPIYSIGVGLPNGKSSDAFAIGPFSFPVQDPAEAVDTQTLQALAAVTGAETYLVRRVGDGELLKKDAALIADAIVSQYSIGFVAASTNDLKLEVRNHPGVTLSVSGAHITVVNAPNPVHQN